jgi:hypothetical protein
MKINDIVQTDRYKRSNYPGRKILVKSVQIDIEPNIFKVTGPFILKDGLETPEIYSVIVNYEKS